MSNRTNVKSPYGALSRESYYRDLFNYTQDTREARSAESRLQQHADFVLATDEARAVRSIMQTHNRSQSAVLEQRAMSSISSSGGTFVTPDYLVEEGAIWNSYPAAAAPQATSVPDPGYGLTMKIPTIQAIASVSQQTTENTGVSESSPSGDYAEGGGSAIITLAGEVPMSLQLFERAGPAPYTIDRIVTIALRDALAAAVDTYLLTQMIAVGGTTTGASSYTAANLFQDVADTQAQIATGAGVRLPATHCFTQPTLAQWLLSSSDTVGRPLLTPVPTQAPTAAKLTATGGAAPGYTATTLLGSHFFSDGNVADVTSTSPVQSQLVFTNAGEVFLQQSEPCVRILPEPHADTLSVLVQLYSFVGVVVRHANAVNTLQADYLLAAPTFT